MAGCPISGPGHKGRTRVIRHGVFIHRDVGFTERRIGVLSGVFLPIRSSSIKWLSVPPDTILWPRRYAAAMACALRITCFW